MKAGFLMLLGLACVNAQTEGNIEKFVLVEQADFTRSKLISMARKALGHTPALLDVVNFYGANGGGPLPKPFHLDYEWWRSQFEFFDGVRMQEAQAIRIGANLVLRIHDSDGSVSRVVLSGHDPLQLMCAGREFEIVYFWFPPIDRLEPQRSVVLFVDSKSHLDLAASARLFQKLERLLPGIKVRVEIENGAWFFADHYYPVRNPFYEYGHVPSRSEFNSTHSITCSRGAKGPQCQLF